MKLSRKHLFLASLMSAVAAAASAQTPMPASGESSAVPAASSQSAERGQRAERGDRNRRGEHGKRDGQRGGKGDCQGRGDHGKNHAEFHAKRMEALKQELKLSSAQEGAWQQFTAAMQPPAAAQGQQRPDRAELEKMSTPQRLDAMQRMADERHAHMRQRSEAVKAFYAQLTPEQQKTFDARAMKGPGKGRHHAKGGAMRGGEGKGQDKGQRQPQQQPKNQN